MARLFLISLAVTIAVSVALVGAEYVQAKTHAIERFEQIEGSTLASIRENAWLQDRERLDSLVQGITNLAYIRRAVVADDDGRVMAAAGEEGGEDPLVRTYRLTRSYLGREVDLGTLTITASLADIRRPILERAWMVLLADLIIALAVSAALYRLVQPLVTLPLERMAAHARALGRADLGALPAPPWPTDGANDEFLDLAIAFGDMSQAIRQSYQAMVDSETRYRTLFDSSPVSLWEEDFSAVKAAIDTVRRNIGSDFFGYLRQHPEFVRQCAALVRVIEVNTATLALHGAPDRDALLGNLGTTFTAKSFEAFERQLLAIWVGEWQLAVDAEVRTLDGQRRQVVVNWLVPEGHRQTLERVVVALEDVTERVAAEHSLEASMTRLMEANSELERFAFVAAHDLQEPVRGIVSFSQLLRRKLGETIDIEAHEFLDYLAAAAERMQAQVLGLISYTRVGGASRSFDATALDQALSVARDTLAATITATGAVIETSALPMVHGDASQLSEVFRNLIDNALKFAQPGVSPRILVDAKRNDSEWLIRVEDNGIGIDPRYAGEIFQVFRRLHGPGIYPGTGIGLATCRRIIERHGGRIWVDFSRSEGATLCFTLPAAQTVQQLGLRPQGSPNTAR
ncbi:sensor histidine kinase [Paramagnetospirillum kuznetsovii]|nr:ATP-binding protein [Paramagnetospirillum kuznetsovii]